jgi:nitroreductase
MQSTTSTFTGEKIMPVLNLSPDELLTTTRSVRKRLDFSRPVEPEVIKECLEIALQAPTGGNRQGWHFVVVTDAEKRQALGDIYRRGFVIYRTLRSAASNLATDDLQRAATQQKVMDSAEYLAAHMHEAPVLIIPCIKGRCEGLPVMQLAGLWGSILPATWSFMLAARARGLGTSWTTIHLFYEQEAAELLGIPYSEVTQAALIPVAYTQGLNFTPATREPLESSLHWNGWND